MLCLRLFVSWLLRADPLLFFYVGFFQQFILPWLFFFGPGGVWAPSPKFAPLQLAPSSVLAPVNTMFTIDGICGLHSRPYHSYNYVKLHV